MQKILLSVVLFGTSIFVYSTNEKFFGPVNKTEKANIALFNPSQDIPSASQATFYVTSHLLNQMIRSSSPELQAPSSSTPIAIPEQAHRRTPSLPQDLIENIKVLGESDSPATTTLAFLLHSPHSETPSVLSVRSTPSSTASSPSAYDLSSLAKESALSSCKIVGIEADKEKAFMEVFMATFTKSLAKRNNSSGSSQ